MVDLRLLVRADAARYDQAPEPVGFQRAHAFGDQHFDHGVDEGARDVRRVALLLDEHERRGFQSREAEIKVAARQHRPRQVVAAGRAALGQRRECRSARVAQAEELRGLVEGLAGRVVLRLTEEAVAAHAVHPHQLSVAARNEKGDEGKCGPPSGEQRRKQVAFQVMDSKYRNRQRFSERVGEGSADQQGAGEPGALGIAHAAQLGHPVSGAFENQARERHEAPNVVARGKLGHDPAVGLVHRHLRMHHVGEQAPLGAVVQRDAGFIAGSLDPEDEHQSDFDTIQPPKEPRAGCRQ